MKLLVENRFALLVLVVAALAALFGAARLSSAALPPPAEEAELVLAPVESTTRVCPTPQGEDRRTLVGGFAPGTENGAGEGSLAVAPNLADTVPAEPTQTVGQPWRHEPEETGNGTVAHAEGVFAAGAEISQTTAGDASVTEIRCTEPSSSTWFAAPGGAELEDLRLHLANIDDTPATVNVDLYAPDGPTFSLETRGVTVDPHTELELAVTSLVEAAEAVVVHVRTNAGRVAAALYAERSADGADWVPVSTAPATSHVIPGVPGGEGNKRLVVATTSDEPTTAQVRLLTPDGEVETEALAEVEIPPAASARVSLEGPLEQRPATVVVTADQPVVVGVSVRRSDDDTAHTAATEPLTPGPNARTVAPPAPEEADTALLLGAPEAAATVALTPVAADGDRGETHEVTVEAGTTLVPELDPADAASWIVEVTDGGPLYAARTLTVDGTLSVLPLNPAPTEVPLPRVVDSLTAVVP
ncbi:hypothetical protein NI17_015375 [Thermobifida halotolerans]|uniref:Uncharacterized protein n=1 Tax=Thermobifida halotolerans TaxID=483545 RepID=A0A399G5D4_9ACTN|nr:DUF5719 family protein [Thermobifida halotolerans]UOE18219.1 hypothetical protein NI17_015375 [Thermobifida halotolerans]